MSRLNKVFFLLTLLFLSLNPNDLKAAECAESSPNVLNLAGAVDGFCETEPASYQIVIYSLHLCTSAPTAPTISTAIDLTNCEIVFENSSGSTVSLSTGGAVNLTGTQTLPPIGTYTHGVIKMNNTFALTASLQFSTSFNGQVSGSGVYCATVDGSGVSSSTDDSADRTICSNTPLTAGTYTETLTSFDEPFIATASASNVAGTGANINAYLVDTNEFLAVNDAGVNKLHGVVEFASPTSITSSTSNIDIRFNVGEGLSVDGNNVGGVYFGSGPFQATIVAN